jgi:hypothetical protein
MSYCVECGVKLGEAEEKCPLCGTVVQNPVHPYSPRTPKPFPVRTPEQNLQIDRRYLLGLISMAMLLPAGLCMLINLLIAGRLTWSLYPVGALVLLFVALAVPILVKKHRIYITITMNSLVLLGYLKMVELLSGSMGWFSPVVFPVIIMAALMVLGITASIRQHLIRELAIPATILAVISLLSLTVELLVSSQMLKQLHVVWSPFVMLPCSFIALMLYLIQSHQPLRDELKKRLHI